MDWAHIEGNWGHFRRRFKQRWHKFTDPQLDETKGQRGRLALNIEKTYQLSPEESERQLADWQARQQAEPPK
jgi:uncharacterized protein YjbJ (UPF0337 family)